MNQPLAKELFINDPARNAFEFIKQNNIDLSKTRVLSKEKLKCVKKTIYIPEKRSKKVRALLNFIIKLYEC